MDDKAKSVITTLGVAFALGLLGDGLLRALPWGINATVWVFVFALVTLKMPAGLGTALPSDRKVLLVLAAVFGACFAWRDSPTLRMLNILALGSVFLACVLPDAVRRLREVTLTHWAQAAGDTIENLLVGLPKLVRKDVPLREAILASSSGKDGRFWIEHGTAVLAGILMTIPLVAVFGALFVSADAAFKVTVSNLFDLRWDTLFSHLFVTALCTWLVAGYLRLLVFRTGQKWPEGNAIEEVKLSGVTLGIPLLSLDLLFLSFVVVQSRYMFGGEDLIQAQTGLTFSSYARQGFFQLVTVALLALLFLLTVDWLAEGIGQGGRRVLRAMMAAMVALVYVVLASALYRMHLYQEEYGFTELRVYTTAFMLWLAVVLLWFLATVLPGKRERFALGALLTGLAV
ncbi:MAG: DUF4173 domain-containing protein, partial [FCB group bacterium]|nr:DUF4173 domain-containing protein [FCB group bacterium]